MSRTKTLAFCTKVHEPVRKDHGGGAVPSSRKRRNASVSPTRKVVEENSARVRRNHHHDHNHDNAPQPLAPSGGEMRERHPASSSRRFRSADTTNRQMTDHHHAVGSVWIWRPFFSNKSFQENSITACTGKNIKGHWFSNRFIVNDKVRHPPSVLLSLYLAGAQLNLFQKFMTSFIFAGGICWRLKLGNTAGCRHLGSLY